MLRVGNSRLKGYLFALAATLAASNVYIFSKAALNEINLLQFGFYWFGFGLIWNLAYSVPKKKFAGFCSLKRSDYIVLFLIGILETAGTALFFLAIRMVENPAIVSFLSNITPVFIVFLGFVFLGERFSFVEIAGFILALAGAFIISLNKESTLAELFIEGTGVIVLSSLILSVSFILAKSRVASLNASLLSTNRIVFLFILSASLILQQGQSLALSHMALINIALGSFLGPFLAAMTGYSAIKYLEASRVSIFQSTKGLFVLIGAYIYFGVFPQSYQLTGGLITIAGVMLIAGGKRIFFFMKTRF